MVHGTTYNLWPVICTLSRAPLAPTSSADLCALPDSQGGPEEDDPESHPLRYRSRGR